MKIKRAVQTTKPKYYAGIGSRETPPEICLLMQNVARFLMRWDYVLRSGGAEGADTAFEQGAGKLKEIYLPWKGFNNNPSELYNISYSAMECAKKFHPAWGMLTDVTKRFHARNCYQVLGYNLDTPVDFIVCYSPIGNVKGGTRQALRIAEEYCIPVYNFAEEDSIDPYDWLKELMP